MKTKEEVSYGVIPYIQENSELYFFLIYQFSSTRKITYWSFPKGHAEKDETPQETAVRELKEETNISVKNFDTEHPFTILYDFVHEDVHIKKSAVFFLGNAFSKEYTLQEKEVKDAGWFTYEEAREKCTFENTKILLDQAFNSIRK